MTEFEVPESLTFISAALTDGWAGTSEFRVISLSHILVDKFCPVIKLFAYFFFI